MDLNSAYLIARVSSKDQEAGYSLSSQGRLMNEYAQRNGLNIVKVFEVAETASKADERKIFGEIFQESIKSKIFNLIFEKVDRSTRSFKWLVKFYDWFEADDRRRLHLVHDHIILHKGARSQDKLNYDMKVVFAKNYADNLSEEIRKGHKEKITQMKYPGPVKFGYKSVGDKRVDHIIHPKTGKLLRQTLELFGTGLYSVDTLCDKAFEIGLRSKSGKRISKSRMHEILKDPFYYGDFIWNGVLYHGSHPHLITRELYLKNQSILSRNKNLRYHKHYYLFRGKVNCGECGGPISWYTKKGHTYGRCNHHRDCTQRICAREDRAEKALCEVLDRFKIKQQGLHKWIAQSLVEENKKQTDYTTTTRSELSSRLNQIENMLHEAYMDKLSHTITEKDYSLTKSKLNAEHEQLESKLSNIAAILKHQTEIGEMIFDLVKYGSSIYQIAPDEYKRTIINVFFENLKLQDGMLLCSVNKGFGLLLRDIKLINSSKIDILENFEKNIFEPVDFLCASDDKSPAYAACSVIRRG